MKPILITIAFLTALTIAKAQTKDDPPKVDIKQPMDSSASLVIEHPQKSNAIFTAVVQEPMPAGGLGGFFRYLQANTRYPDSSFKKRIEGKVFVTFVVEKDGSLTDIKVTRSVAPDIDAEAIRVMGTAPKWKPGIQNGIAVRVQYSMAISFKLPDLPNVIVNVPKDYVYNPADSGKIFTAVEQEPSPVGGMAGFYQYLEQNIHYPESAKRKNIQGKVFLTFIVEKNGSLSNIRVLRGVSEDIDAEAVRVMKNAPKWNPGMQQGRPVRVQYNVPLSFALKVESN